MIYNVYGLVSPIDEQVVYVGMTTHSIEHRLKQHYWHLNEVNRGERKTNKRFEYLKSILPLKVTIKLLTSFLLNTIKVLTIISYQILMKIFSICACSFIFNEYEKSSRNR